MRKLFLLFFVYLLIAQPLLAQEISEPLLQQESPQMRNEVWVGITPVLQALLGGGFRQPELALSYKRNIQGFWWFKIRGSISPLGGLGFNQSINYVFLNDTTVLQRFHQRRGFISEARIGLERRSANGRLQRYFSIDLSYMQARPERSLYEATYRFDSLRPLPQTGFYGEQIGTINELHRDTRIMHRPAIGVTAGILYPFSERFAIAAQAFMDLGFRWEEIRTQNFTNGENRQTRSGASFTQDYLALGELSFIFRFR
jgi:hypothetical protein